jgi:hypothetical protein
VFKRMRTVISHFFNEEFLLPWWIKHHLRIFDHGVMINHGSTDRSVEVIRDLAPHWKIVNSQLSQFDAVFTDFEVMQQESYLPGFKMALTVTEFVISTVPFEEVDRFLVDRNLAACCAKGVIMVDPRPDAELSPEHSLFAQKHHGYLEPTDNQCFSRVYHRASIGQYLPGRHRSWLPDSKVQLSGLFVLKYHYSPWVPEFVQRKLQIRAKLPAVDPGNVKGVSHNRTSEEMERDYSIELGKASDLMGHAELMSAIRLWA